MQHLPQLVYIHHSYNAGTLHLHYDPRLWQMQQYLNQELGILKNSPLCR
jgi:hypothetical protein